MTLTLVTLALTLAVFGLVAISYRARARRDRCPTCDSPWAEVCASGEGPNETYDILACTGCSNTATRVHGLTSSLAYCPACKHRSLATLTSRQSTTGRSPKVHVEVQETCHLCGFEHRWVTHQQTDAVDPRPMARVIPFPKPGERRPRRQGGDGR